MDAYTCKKKKKSTGEGSYDVDDSGMTMLIRKKEAQKHVSRKT